MPPKAKPIARAPGYEPAKGFPDPNAPKPPPVPPVGYHTHLPAGNGPVCGFRPTPTDAKFYDPVDPTCPPCAAWLAAAKRNTAGLLARQGAARPADEPAPPTPRDRP